MTISDGERMKREDDKQRLEWNTYRMHSGNGFVLTNDEATVLSCSPINALRDTGNVSGV